MDILIDGSFGEGGGQVVRTALGLSMVTGKPFRIENIRANRSKPGLRAQHIASAAAAARIASARLSGAEPGSTTLEFEPGPVQPGVYHFDIGTAGSTSLVLQTVLPALLCAGGPSTVTVTGGTHNPMAPPVSFLDRAFGRIVRAMGPGLGVHLEKNGFYPKGGGRVALSVEPAPRLEPFHLAERGVSVAATAQVWGLNVPDRLADRERRVLRDKLGWTDAAVSSETFQTGNGTALMVFVTLAFERITEVVTVMSERGQRPEDVTEAAAAAVKAYLAHGAPVGEHLADQLLIPMALAGGGSFLTAEPTLHATTNIAIIERFLDVRFAVEKKADNLHEIRVERR